MGQTSNRARNQNRMLQLPVVQSTDLGRYLFSKGTTFEILSPQSGFSITTMYYDHTTSVSFHLSDFYFQSRKFWHFAETSYNSYRTK